MKTERVIELIDKLVEEKLKLATILNSKSLGSNKEFFLIECRKKIGQIKMELAIALETY